MCLVMIFSHCGKYRVCNPMLLLFLFACTSASFPVSPRIERLHNAFTRMQPSCAQAIDAIGKRFVDLVREPTAADDLGAVYSTLAQLISVNQHLLCALGVGHRSLDALGTISQA